MNRSHFLPRLSLWLTVALTLVGVVARSAAMLTCFDKEIGYFNGGFLPTLADILYPMVILAAVLIPFFIPENTLPRELIQRQRLPVAILMGCGLAAFTFIGLVLFFPAIPPKDAPAALLTSFATQAAPVILALPASLYYFFSAGRHERYPDGLALVGFLPVLWSAAGIADTYTDLYTAMNSPIKIVLQFGFIGMMLIMVAELRFRLGKSAPRIALALFSIGTFLCLNGSLPLIVAAFAGVITNSRHIAYAAALLFGGLYGGFTLLSFVYSPTALPAEDDSPADDSPAQEIPTGDESTTD